MPGVHAALNVDDQFELCRLLNWQIRRVHRYWNKADKKLTARKQFAAVIEVGEGFEPGESYTAAFGGPLLALELQLLIRG